MDLTAYLRRIDYRGKLEPTLEVLTELHRAHLFSVPFENLDIILRRPIVLSLPALYEKVVLRQRGGFCYELNALFCWLLKEIGFEVQMLSGRVFSGEKFGAEFDHMLLKVSFDDDVVADVGFGDSFVDPLILSAEEQSQTNGAYRFFKEDDDWVLSRKTSGAEWQAQYCFTLQPRLLNDYETMCSYHQTSPESSFTRESVCSLVTPDGRITLSGNRLLTTNDGYVEEQRVRSTSEYRTLLAEHFRLELEASEDVRVLLHNESTSSNDRH
jgi:N-hydroxyarylamine O-acetyltransferase